MKLKNAKILVIILILACAACIAGLSIFLFIPTFKANAGLASSITLAYAQLDAQYANRKNLLSSHDKVAHASEVEKNLSEQFVDEGKEIDFIKIIEELASKNNVEQHIQLTQSEGGEVPEIKTRFALTINGTYRNTMQMLLDMEKSTPLILVNSMDIRPGEVEGGVDFLQITVHGSIVSPPPSPSL